MLKTLAPQSGIIFAIKIIKSKAKVVPDWGNPKFENLIKEDAMNFLNLLLGIFRFLINLTWRITRAILRLIRRYPRRAFFVAVGFTFVVGTSEMKAFLIGLGVIVSLLFAGLNLIKKEIPGPIRSILGLGKKK